MSEHDTPLKRETADVTSIVAQKRPYTAPQLRALGSVRDLTLGSGNARQDLTGRKHKN
jgi:hypothetical protein